MIVNIICYTMYMNLDPVVQSIVSLTISLRHKFVKQISAKVTNSLLFFVDFSPASETKYVLGYFQETCMHVKCV